MVNCVIPIFWKPFCQCCMFLQCHTAQNTTGDCLRTPLLPVISALFQWFVKTQFLTATALGICLLLLNYIQVSYPHSSILSLHISLFYTDFFSLFGRVFQVSSLSKSLCSKNFFFSCHCKFSKILGLINSLHYIRYNCACILSPILTVAENTFKFSMFYCWNIVFSHSC